MPVCHRSNNRSFLQGDYAGRITGLKHFNNSTHGSRPPYQNAITRFNAKTTGTVPAAMPNAWKSVNENGCNTGTSNAAPQNNGNNIDLVEFRVGFNITASLFFCARGTAKRGKVTPQQRPLSARNTAGDDHAPSAFPQPSINIGAQKKAAARAVMSGGSRRRNPPLPKSQRYDASKPS